MCRSDRYGGGTEGLGQRRAADVERVVDIGRQPPASRQPMLAVALLSHKPGSGLVTLMVTVQTALAAGHTASSGYRYLSVRRSAATAGFRQCRSRRLTGIGNRALIDHLNAVDDREVVDKVDASGGPLLLLIVKVSGAVWLTPTGSGELVIRQRSDWSGDVNGKCRGCGRPVPLLAELTGCRWY